MTPSYLTHREIEEVERPHLFQGERWQLLHKVVWRLPEKSLRLLRSRYEDENSALDIADEFEMKAPAVRKALERVRVSLRKCMEKRLEAGPVTESA